MEEIKVTEQESPAVEAAEARVEVEETKKQPVASNASVKPEDSTGTHSRTRACTATARRTPQSMRRPFRRS